jgi:hypothetical protein
MLRIATLPPRRPPVPYLKVRLPYPGQRTVILDRGAFATPAPACLVVTSTSISLRPDILADTFLQPG